MPPVLLGLEFLPLSLDQGALCSVRLRSLGKILDSKGRIPGRQPQIIPTSISTAMVMYTIAPLSDDRLGVLVELQFKNVQYLQVRSQESNQRTRVQMRTMPATQTLLLMLETGKGDECGVCCQLT